MNKISYEDLSYRWKDIKNQVLGEISDLIDSGYYVGGTPLKRFESLYASMNNKKYCVGVSSGMTALELGIYSLKINKKLNSSTRVYMPCNTYIATVLAVINNNLTPVLVSSKDILPNVDDYLEAIDFSDPFIILDVPMYGIPRPSQRLAEICVDNDSFFLEDLSQCHGGLDIDGNMCGNFSLMQFWSFYPTKNIGGIGESGAITTCSTVLSDICYTLRNYGSIEKYKFEMIGTNGRMDNIQAILLYNYITYKFETILSRRRYIALKYNQNIRNIDVSIPWENFLPGHAFHIYPIICKKNRDRFKEYLSQHGVETAIHYPISLNQQKALNGMFGSIELAEKFSMSQLSLPLNPALSDREVDLIITIVNEYNDNIDK